MSNPELHVIFGTGPVGQSIAQELVGRGKAVKMVNRSGQAPRAVPANVQTVAADVWNSASLDAAVQGATHVYQAAQPAYHEWVTKFVPFQKNILDATARARAKLVVVDNLYMYADTNGKPINEQTPVSPHTRKGNARAQAAQAILDAHNAGRVQAVIGRASNFFGPAALDSTHGARMFGFAAQGKAADLYGSVNLPHSATYVQDFGKALVVLGENDAAFGRAWIVPTAKPVSQREFAEMIFAELGQPPKYRAVGRTMLSLFGLFAPPAKEMVEMMYEFEKPYIVDSNKFEKLLQCNRRRYARAFQKPSRGTRKM
ncbi:MAG: NAD-dependent epimerase/dehydratase family protein [Chloroflexi bacterium]|nr:NAD-dependent epimerase/dehydratase family protein [Chloroflexota bacterium]